MVDYLAKKCKLPKGSAPVGMRRTGNAGPASIPLMLAVVRDEFPPERRARAVFCGFGVGLSWGACAVELGATILLPPVELMCTADEPRQSASNPLAPQRGEGQGEG
jgi:3-oxoacyl-[acyl-carrier-protein] synthase-3